MKRIFALMLVCLLLTGCGSNSEIDRAMSLRERLRRGDGCTFDTVITADYGEKTYSFAMACASDSLGNLNFTVTEPETIAGITGTISENSGELTFDNQALAFEMLADGQITPVSAPWLLIYTLRSGYLSSCGEDGEYFRIRIDDSYEDEALQLDIWVDENDNPVSADILWDGRRVVSLAVKNFTIM